MKIKKPKYRGLSCCRYCLEELRSRGEVMLDCGDLGAGKCDWCDEVDELITCLWEVEQ